MKTNIISILAIISLLLSNEIIAQDAKTILEKVDENMFTQTKITESTMIVYGKRRDRQFTSITYNRGEQESYSEYLSPAREKGTKMLKLEDKLWVYSPSSDRIIQMSGHMLRQSMMGSDISYEDMMQEKKLLESYEAKILREEQFEGRATWLLELKAVKEDVSYAKMHIWVDQEYFVPLKEELFAKSGTKLKSLHFSKVEKVGNRYFPMHMNYKDVLKEGKGTDLIVNKLQCDVDIPEHVFNKANLRK
ncbi:outer membrane lipoprotein-sorting protein [Persicobacter diffluens]|uniref:Uncharacterized protein TP-0789 domain-containing protein n=1 Tax=Persicobacter diffluens TaxID=981 RepID=A0AAN4W0D2_9BACT|nr:hypothetical protein PEDI_33640 [Persicobacter diffluens]